MKILGVLTRATLMIFFSILFFLNSNASAGWKDWFKTDTVKNAQVPPKEEKPPVIVPKPVPPVVVTPPAPMPPPIVKPPVVTPPVKPPVPPKQEIPPIKTPPSDCKLEGTIKTSKVYFELYDCQP